MKYQEVFQGLKGIGSVDLSSLCLPVDGTEFVLAPVNCNSGKIDEDIVNMLTEARNFNADSFLTYFTATPQRTFRWIVDTVASDDTRILFAVRNLHTAALHGYMGLAHGDSTGDRIEGDAIVRFAAESRPGLMRKAFLRLVTWVKFELGLSEVWVRVLSDNPAIEFYKKCDFMVAETVPLFEVRAANGELLELSESRAGDLAESPRTLSYMRYRI